MGDPWREDPVADSAGRLWRRVRVPLGLLFLVGTGVRSRELLLSGEVFPVLTWVMTMAFWAYVFLVPRRRISGRPDAEELRTYSGHQVRVWGTWLAVGLVWLVAATILGGWSWARALILLPPLLLVVLSLPVYLRPGRAAARVQAAAEERSTRRT